MEACPRCNGDAILESSLLGGVEVSICRQCRSILMMRTDLEAIVASVGRKSTQEVKAAPAGFFERLRHAARFVSEGHSLRCPLCRYDMYEVQSHDLLVDFCLNCQAIWFDEGELRATLEKARAQGSIQLIPDDLGDNATAELICYFLDAATESK